MPRGRNPFILLLALASGAIAFILVLRMMGPSPAPVTTSAETGEKVVMAVRDIHIGTGVRREDVNLAPVSGNPDLKMHYQGVDEVIGKVVRRNIPKGEMLRKVDILEEGDNLASLIPHGYRAMTIPVALPGNIKEMLRIGNRVDVILTYEADRGDFKSLTLVQNARVIGVETLQGSAAASAKSVNITLAVTPDGAETLAFATRRGTLNISIRSLQEEGKEKFFTLRELFFPEKKEEGGMDPRDLLARDRPKMPQDVIEIIRGVDKQKVAAEWQ